MYHRQLLSMRRTWTVLVSAFLLACGGGSESPAPSTSQTTASTTGSANGGAGGTTSTGGFGGSPQPCDDGADPAPPEALTDCNDNGVADDKEIADGGLDCNGNTVVDECEDVTGCTSWGRENYIEYKAGSLPIVLSAPHGGSLTPAELPELQGVSIGGDLKTIELAEAISDGLLSLAGRRPHLVFCHVYRKRLECNRDRVKGTEGNPFAEQAWDEYHAFIEAAQASVVHHFGSGVYVDVHGLAASKPLTELGYLLTGTQLTFGDRLNHEAMVRLTSLQPSVAAGTSFTELLRGSSSIGGLLDSEFAVVPSPTNPDPGLDAQNKLNHYFNGGYNTRRHGAYHGGSFSGLQVEGKWTGVRDTAANRAAFGLAMASALLKFVDTHLGLDVASPSRVRLIASDPRVSETGSHGAVEIRRQGSLAEQASGKLIVSGTATEGSDYAPIDKSWTLAKGQASLVIDIEPLADDELEGPETIRFDLAEVKGSHPVDKTTALLHIADAARPAAWIDSAQDAVEGASPIAFTVVRDSCAAPLSVTLDYGPSAPDGAPTTVDFAQGEVRKDVAIDLPVDGLATGRRRLTVAAAPGDGYAPGPWSGTLWIEDADLDTDLARWWRLQLSDSAVVEHTAGVDGAAYPSSSGPVATKAMAKEAFDALAFDGVDDVLILKPPTLGPVFSVALAFRADSAAPPNAYQYLWSHGKVTYRNSLNIYLTSSGTLRTGLRGADDDWVYNALQPSGDWRDDTWHHYALCVENGAAKVYLDGALKVSASLGAGGLSPNTHIVVGARVDLHVDRHFQGQLADVRIYQRALAPADVAAIAAPYAP